jgi:ribonuclease D
MANRGIVKIMHGADYDVVCMQRDFGFEVFNLFDTMISAQLLNLPKVGLADLCGTYFGAQMDKKYQRHDWAERPLLPEHVDYARGDTHYLLALREILHRKLDKLDRLDIAAEEFKVIQAREWSGRAFDDDGWVRMKRIAGLDDKSRMALRHLWRYRDGKARSADRPPYKIIPEPVLVLLAQHRPKTEEDMGRHVRSRSTMVRRHGEHLLAAILAAEVDEIPLPPPQPKTKARVGPKAPHRGREVDRLLADFKRWRTDVVQNRGVPVALVASNAQLKNLAAFRPATPEALAQVPEVRTWQIARYGEEWLEFIAEFVSTLSSGQRLQPEPRTSGRRRRRRRRRSGEDEAGAPDTSSTPDTSSAPEMPPASE